MNTEIRSQKPVWEQVIERVGEFPVGGTTRLDIARYFNVHKSTAQSHLEKGVERGALVKVYTWTGRNSRGWVYFPADVRTAL